MLTRKAQVITLVSHSHVRHLGCLHTGSRRAPGGCVDDITFSDLGRCEGANKEGGGGGGGTAAVL